MKNLKNLFHRKKKTTEKVSVRDRIKSLSKKQKIAAIVIIVLVLALGIGAGVFFYLKKSSGSQGFGGMGGMGGMNAGISTDGMIAASGVISVGVTEEEFSVENLTTTLEIEEVYVSSEEEIEEGTKILKLNDEDVAEAREELEKTLRTAELAYRSGAIEYEQNLITAVYDRDTALLAGEQAQEVYDETVASLDEAVEQAQEALDEANEDIAEYESYVNDGSYSTYFKVDEYQQIYDEDLDILVDYMEEYDVGWEQVTGGGGGGMGGGDAQAVSMLQSLYKILETDLQNLEQAQKDYEDAVNNASFELQTLQLNLPSLEQALTEAQENYDTQLLQAKLTYETSLSNAESAQSDYETAVQKAESDYDTLRETYEDAQENLELFETLVGDGYFYATGSGTILRMNVRSGGTLTSESIILMYSNPEDMTVTVSVDQSYIADLNVGDTAVVVTSDYGNFEGSVTEINPVSNSSSRASVTYSVTVQLEGDSTAVPANESVTVIFGVTLEQINAQMNNNGNADVSGGDATIGGSGEMPNGDGTGENQPGGEMPSGEAPSGGEMPSGEMPSGAAPQGEVNGNAQ